MQAGKLTGGRVRKTDRNRLWLSPQASDPQMRMGTPGNLELSVGCYAQYCWCAQQEIGEPEPTVVHTFLYETDQGDYLVLAVPKPEQTPETDMDVHELKFERAPNAPTVRGLEPLLVSANVQVREDRWYYMKTSVMEVEGYGRCVVGNWTQAEAVPRSRGNGGARQDAAATEEAPQE